MFKPFDQDLDLVSMQPSVEASGTRKRPICPTSLLIWSGRILLTATQPAHTHALAVSLGLCNIHVDTYLYMEKACGANLFPCTTVKTKGAPLSTSNTNPEIKSITEKLYFVVKIKGDLLALSLPRAACVENSSYRFTQSFLQSWSCCDI